jgi:hypothetical protein
VSNTKRILTEEIKDKLKAIGGFNIEETIKIVPTQYKELPKEFWPVFEFEQFNAIELLQFQNLTAKLQEASNDQVVDVFSDIIKKLDNKLICATNIIDENGTVLDIYEGEISRLITDVRKIADIAVQVVVGNKLTDEEKEGLT